MIPAPAVIDLPSTVELAAAVVLAGLVLVVRGVEPLSMLLLYLAAVSPALCVSDLTRRRLPDRLVIPGYFVAGGVLLLAWARGETIPESAVIASAAYFAFLLVLAVLGGMGMGDVKLAGVLGFAAGGLGAGAALMSPVFAFGLGSFAALTALAQRTGRSIPFGPCMIAGFWGAALAC